MLFNIKGESVQLFPAKVVETYYKDDKPESTFYIKAQVLDGRSTNRLVNARPLFVNIKQPPLDGEVVLLMSTMSSYGNGLAYNEDTYYLGVINLQGNVHHASIPNVNEITSQTTAGGSSEQYQTGAAGSTTKNKPAKVDKKFPESTLVKSLQPYVGDVIIEGRFGNSIRLTSSLKNADVYSKQAQWNKGDGAEGDPMMIIRTSKPTQNTGKTNDFVTEDFNKDDSFIVLQSGQSLNFTPSSTATDSIKNKTLDSWNTGKKFSGKQILINSGRIVFNSTQNEIIAFAKKGIGLSSAGSIAIDAQQDIEASANKILLGKNADEPLLLGNKTKTWTDEFIDALGNLTVMTAIGPSSPLSASPGWAQILSIKAKYQNNLSQLSFTKLSK